MNLETETGERVSGWGRRIARGLGQNSACEGSVAVLRGMQGSVLSEWIGVTRTEIVGE